MEYTPHFAQPFSLVEAINLDLAIITEGQLDPFQRYKYCKLICCPRKSAAEIARLQNSLRHLKETQTILQVDLDEPGEVDSEVAKAFEENKLVIGSQEERISILKMALTEKGIMSGSHYEVTSVASQSVSQAGGPDISQSPTGPDIHAAASRGNTEDNGVYL